MQTLAYKMLRQILSNQFTMLKHIKNPKSVTHDHLEKRLEHTDKLLTEAYGPNPDGA